MTTTTKILLGVSLTAFALSITGAFWGIFMPVGAIFLGLFMNFYILAKEAAVFDEEQRLRASIAENKGCRVQQTTRVEGRFSLSGAAR